MIDYLGGRRRGLGWIIVEVGRSLSLILLSLYDISGLRVGGE